MKTKIYLIACHICDNENGYDEDKVIKAFSKESDAKFYQEKLDNLIYLLQFHRERWLWRQKEKRPSYRGIADQARDVSVVKIETVILTP